MEVPLTGLGKTMGGREFRGKDPEFGVGCVKIAILKLSGGVK